MGNSWLRSRTNGNVSASGCGEPIPPSVFLADAEQRRAQRAVTAWPSAVVVRLHPSASRRRSPRDEALVASASFERHGKAGNGTARTLASLFGHGEIVKRAEKRLLGFSVN